MCGLKIASGVFLESWKLVADGQWRRQKRTKNSPRLHGWLIKERAIYIYVWIKPLPLTGIIFLNKKKKSEDKYIV